MGMWLPAHWGLAGRFHPAVVAGRPGSDFPELLVGPEAQQIQGSLVFKKEGGTLNDSMTFFQSNEDFIIILRNQLVWRVKFIICHVEM